MPRTQGSQMHRDQTSSGVCRAERLARRRGHGGIRWVAMMDVTMDEVRDVGGIAKAALSGG